MGNSWLFQGVESTKGSRERLKWEYLPHSTTVVLQSHDNSNQMWSNIYSTCQNYARINWQKSATDCVNGKTIKLHTTFIWALSLHAWNVNISIFFNLFFLLFSDALEIRPIGPNIPAGLAVDVADAGGEPAHRRSRHPLSLRLWHWPRQAGRICPVIE